MPTTTTTTKCDHKHYVVCPHDRETRMADRASRTYTWVSTHCSRHGELRIDLDPGFVPAVGTTLIGPMYCPCSYNKPEWLAEKV
jgi:hypothetical protein